MDIVSYLGEIKYACENLIPTIWYEYQEYERLRIEVENLNKIVSSEYLASQQIQQYAEDSDDLMFGVGRHWDTYFGSDKELHYKSNDLNLLEQRCKIHEWSIASLSGSVLQYAKQGLSLAFGQPSKWPDGRLIGSQNIKQIIRFGRNQSMHWEEGIKEECKKCFLTLENEFGYQFSQYSQKNLAFEIIRLFNWTSFKSFETDLLLMSGTNLPQR